MTTGEERRQTPLRRSPLWRVVCVTLLTVLHYGLSAALLLVAYALVPAVAWPLAVSYLVFAVVQRWVYMPLVVCPGCVYLEVSGGRCPCGNSLIARRLTRFAAVTDGFAGRASGLLSPARLDRAALILPLLVALPGLLLAHSRPAVYLAVIVCLLLVLRSVLMTPLTCSRCLARRWCPLVRRRQAAR